MSHWGALLVFLSLLFPIPTLAVSLSLDGCPGSILPDQEFSVTATLDCENCSDSYLRGVLFPSGTSYFGYTKNHHGEWIGSVTDKTQYFKIAADEVISGSWSAQLSFKPETENRHYLGPGPYSFKIIRYTASGNKSTETQTSTIQIQGPTHTPVPPTSTSTPKNTSTPTSIPLVTQAPLPTALTPTRLVLSLSSDVSPVPTTPRLVSPSPTPTISPKPHDVGGVLSSIGIIGIGLSTLMFILPPRNTST